MLYDPERTRSIVDRLVLLGNNLRTAVVLICVIQFTALLGILGALVWNDAWGIFALVGALAGGVIGLFLSSVFAILLEWMAQLLISIRRE